MRRAGWAIAMLVVAVPLQAQTGPSSQDPRDKIAPKEMSLDGEPTPWWMALADCGAIYRQATEDRPKVQAFATSAMAQVAKDRGVTIRQAAAVVMPYLMTGDGHKGASALAEIYGGDVTGLRKSCDGVMAKYKAL